MHVQYVQYDCCCRLMPCFSSFVQHLLGSSVVHRQQHCISGACRSCGYVPALWHAYFLCLGSCQDTWVLTALCIYLLCPADRPCLPAR